MRKDSHLDFKRCLQVLKLTNKELARLLSQEREDGQNTSEATISRWATGATPVDPGVKLYLKNRLIALAKNMPARPLDGQAIGFGGGKGGAGASSLSAGIAVTLNKIGYRVIHVTISNRCNNKYLIDTIQRFITCVTLNTAEFQENLEKFKSSYDFILVDMYKNMIIESKDDVDVLNLIKSIDLLVLPVDVLSPADLWATEEAYSTLDNIQCNNRLIINFSRHLEFFGILHEEFLQRMKPWMNYIYPQSLPMVSGALLVPKVDPENLFGLEICLQSIDLEVRYLDISSAILERIGVQLDTKPIENLDFNELLDRLIHA